METRAPFVIVGAFVLAAIAAVFGFVYWLHKTGGLAARSTYHVQFNGPVPGLLIGAAVLFNGIRVGEVTNLGLAPESPRQVNATIAVASSTPMRADTKVGLEFLGLTGVPVIALEGGKEIAVSGEIPTLVAEPGAGQSMTQAARDALRRVDSVLAENAEPLRNTISNLEIFSQGLAKNTGRLDSIVAGLERMTGGSAPPASKVIYNLRVPQNFTTPKETLKGQLVIPEPTALVMFETQRILVIPPSTEHSGFSNVQWADNIPKMLQAALLQSFETYDIEHAPLRPMDGIDASYQLLIDVRSFGVIGDTEPVAEIAFSARILSGDGRVIASRLFQERQKLAAFDPSSAVTAFGDAFESITRQLIPWTIGAL